MQICELGAQQSALNTQHSLGSGTQGDDEVSYSTLLLARRLAVARLAAGVGGCE